MHAHPMLDILQTPAAGAWGPFLYAHGGLPAAENMLRSLTRFGVTEAASLDVAAVVERLDALRPNIVFVDFSAARLDRAVELVTAVRGTYPQIPLVAVGSTSDASGALAALRAGVQEFADVQASEAEMSGMLQRMLGGQNKPVNSKARSVALLGARAGLGVTTLAASLSILLNAKAHASKAEAASNGNTKEGVALLDLGLPAGDGMLYLDLRGEFSFVDAVRSLHRFDQTLVQTAFSQVGSTGLRVLPLPQQLGELRNVSHAESSALVSRLQAFFAWQVMDLGGFSNLDFMARVAREAGDIWLVCDQSVSAIVATAELVRGLADRGVEASRLSVVVNAYDSRIDITPDQVAQRLGLALAGRVPERRVPLVQAANLGKLLVQEQPRDPYTQAVNVLIDKLLADVQQTDGALTASNSGDRLRSLPKFSNLLNRISHGKRN